MMPSFGSIGADYDERDGAGNRISGLLTNSVADMSSIAYRKF